MDFFTRPIPLLREVLGQIAPETRAALACLYLAGEELRAPIEFTDPLRDAITRLGATEASVLQAFGACDGTFLQLSQTPGGDPVWRFRHPTIREGFAAVVAQDPNMVTVFLDGLSDEELVRQVECGGPPCGEQWCAFHRRSTRA